MILPVLMTLVTGYTVKYTLETGSGFQPLNAALVLIVNDTRRVNHIEVTGSDFEVTPITEYMTYEQDSQLSTTDPIEVSVLFTPVDMKNEWITIAGARIIFLDLLATNIPLPVRRYCVESKDRQILANRQQALTSC